MGSENPHALAPAGRHRLRALGVFGYYPGDPIGLRPAELHAIPGAGIHRTVHIRARQPHHPPGASEDCPQPVGEHGVGSIFLPANVADLVQRATALELEKTGILLSDSNPLELSGDVLEFKADDLGYSVD